MADTQRPTEEDVFDLQIGLGQSCVAIEDRHFYDIAGYLELGRLLSPSQVQQARAQLQTARAEKDDQIEQWIHIIEAGGVLEDAMALASVRPIYRNSSGATSTALSAPGLRYSRAEDSSASNRAGEPTSGAMPAIAAQVRATSAV